MLAVFTVEDVLLSCYRPVVIEPYCNRLLVHTANGLYFIFIFKEKKEETETSPRRNIKGERKEKASHEKQNCPGWFALPNNLLA